MTRWAKSGLILLPLAAAVMVGYGAVAPYQGLAQEVGNAPSS